MDFININIIYILYYNIIGYKKFHKRKFEWKTIEWNGSCEQPYKWNKILVVHIGSSLLWKVLLWNMPFYTYIICMYTYIEEFKNQKVIENVLKSSGGKRKEFFNCSRRKVSRLDFLNRFFGFGHNCRRLLWKGVCNLAWSQLPF